MSSTNASFHSQQGLVREAPNGGSSPRWLDDVDNVDIMSILSDLINHPATPNTPTSTNFTLQDTMSSVPSTPIRSSAATFRPITLESIHSPAQKQLRALVFSPISASPASTSAATEFTTPVASLTINAQRSAPTTRRDRFPRRRSTHRHPLPHPQLQRRTIIHRKALRSTLKRPDRRRSRTSTYWPVWYQEQRQRGLAEAECNMKLDERRRWELMEQKAEEDFLTELLTDHLKMEVLRLALGILRRLREWEEMED